jgi:hypothetical protein
VSRRAASEAYRSDEDVYTFLALCGGLLILGGIFLVLASIFRALRKIDNLNSSAVGSSRGGGQPILRSGHGLIPPGEGCGARRGP